MKPINIFQREKKSISFSQWKSVLFLKSQCSVLPRNSHIKNTALVCLLNFNREGLSSIFALSLHPPPKLCFLLPKKERKGGKKQQSENHSENEKL